MQILKYEENLSGREKCFSSIILCYEDIFIVKMRLLLLRFN